MLDVYDHDNQWVFEVDHPFFWRGSACLLSGWEIGCKVSSARQRIRSGFGLSIVILLQIQHFGHRGGWTCNAAFLFISFQLCPADVRVCSSTMQHFYSRISIRPCKICWPFARSCRVQPWQNLLEVFAFWNLCWTNIFAQIINL